MRVDGREKYAIPSDDWKEAGMSGHHATVDSRGPPVRFAAGTAIVGVVANHGYQFIKNYCPGRRF
ncbi:hypothetical protein JNB71_00985 [Rhizobium herbae]|uniref:Uncharacterized protein n=1 Tax=Rhizobium herbae TaxID=508661 RepID=A0ABS7H5Z8_9HYPH|nr:hypothetical protein [Rhizobium herbae]MBW9061889.1 hypothetical protein [Rhizobium herbae]